MVPSGEKVYSIVESHTELIMRGKAEEFGHKVLLCQTGEKLISHSRVLSGEEQDKDLGSEALERHKGLFGKNPDVFSAA